MPLSTWNGVLSGSGAYTPNEDGSTGFECWGHAVFQTYYDFPNSGLYRFTIPACYYPGATASYCCFQFSIDSIMCPVFGQQVDPFIAFCTQQQQDTTHWFPTQKFVFTAWCTAGWHSLCLFMMPNGGSGGNTILHCDGVQIDYTGATLPGEPAGARDPSQHPFSSYAIWNTAIGSNAQWSAAGDADTAALTAAGNIWQLNSHYYEPVFYEGQATDPIYSWSCSNITAPVGSGPSDAQTIHAPTGMTPDPGKDAALAITDATNLRYSYAGIGAVVNDTTKTVTTTMARVVDHYNAFNYGLDQSISYFAGMIRDYDLQQGVIAHMLSIGFAEKLVAPVPTPTTGLSWPSSSCDSDGPTNYTGAIKYGCTVGIPATTAMPAGLSQGGQMLFKCLQDYGALHNITTGNPESQVTIYAELAADTNPLTAQMRTDWPTIGPLLRIMRNQGPDSINGGGTPRQPILPGVIAGLPAIKV